MKSESEVMEKYIDYRNDRDFFENLTVAEKILYRCQIKDTLDFKRFLLHEIFLELFELIIHDVKKLINIEK